MKNLEQKINRAKELITTSKHIAFATTNEDGAPHNSPMRFFYDDPLEHIYWGSNTETLHSQNILRTGHVFGVLFYRIEYGGVYIKLEDGHILKGKELEIALEIINSFRVKEGSEPIELSYYTDDRTQKIWSAKIASIWINSPVRDENGYILRDERVEIEREHLLQNKF